MAEGFLDDEATPAGAVFDYEAGAGELGGDAGDEGGRDGEVEEAVAAGVAGLLDSLETGLEGVEGGGGVEVGLLEGGADGEPVEDGGVDAGRPRTALRESRM